MPTWLLISALLHSKAFIRAALRAEDLQAIMLALGDLGCEHPNLIKQKTLSQAGAMQPLVTGCLIAMTRQNYWEDVCGLVTQRLNFRSVLYSSSAWGAAPIGSLLPSEALDDLVTSQRGLEEDCHLVEASYRDLPCIQRQDTAPVFQSAGPLPFSFKLLQLSDSFRVLHFTQRYIPVFNWNVQRKGSVDKNTDFPEVSCFESWPDT